MGRAVCFSADEILGLAGGRYPALEVGSALGHMDQCASCRKLLVEAMKWPEDGPAAPLLVGRRVFSDGDVVASRYEVIGFIGRGGMGEVYRVTDRTLERRVALKTVSSLAGHGGASLSRLRREAHLARLITHPNVCRVFDFGEHAGDHGTVPFLTMELVEGVTLARRSSDGRLAPEVIRPIVTGIAAGLAAAHEAGVIHRDLTPRNVILRGGGNGTAPDPVVMDFGLARPTVPARDWGASMSEGMVPGTPAYIAPEQILGYEATPAVDIYAFGVLFYEMITGSLPFEGPPMAMASRRLVHDPSPLAAPPGTPPHWKSLVAQCLRRDPRERPQSFQVILRALGGDVTVLRVEPRRRSRKTTAVALVGFGAVAAVSAALFLTRGRAAGPAMPAAVALSAAPAPPPAPPADRPAPAAPPARTPPQAPVAAPAPLAAKPQVSGRRRARDRATPAPASAEAAAQPAVPAVRAPLQRDEVIDAFAAPAR